MGRKTSGSTERDAMTTLARSGVEEGHSLARITLNDGESSGRAIPHVVTGLSLLRLLFWIAAFSAPALIRIWQEIWR